MDLVNYSASHILLRMILGADYTTPAAPQGMNHANRDGCHLPEPWSNTNVTAEAAVVAVPATAMLPVASQVRPAPEPSNTIVISPPSTTPAGAVKVLRMVVPVVWKYGPVATSVLAI